MSAMYSKYTREDGLQAADERVPNLLLRNARKQQSWTRQMMAEKAKVSAVSIGRWERGEGVPNQYDRDLLCQLFQMSAEDLGFSSEQERSVSPDPQEPAQPYEARTSSYPPFHEQLRYERERRGWSQNDVAEKMECDTKTVGRWESGVRLPRPYHRQRLYEIFGKNAEEFGLTESGPVPTATSSSRSTGGEVRRFSTPRSLILNLPVPCGDCEQPCLTASLETIVIDPKRHCTTFYLRFTNRTAEDAGLRFESLSLTDPEGGFVLGQSVGSFLVEADQSSRVSAVFQWVPERKTPYKFNVVLVRPDKWRNSYRPVLLKL